MSKIKMIQSLQAKRLAIDTQIRQLEGMSSPSTVIEKAITRAIHALEISKGFLGKMVGALGNPTPYKVADKAADIPPTADKADTPLMRLLTLDELTAEVNKAREVIKALEEASFNLSEEFWAEVDDTDPNDPEEAIKGIEDLHVKTDFYNRVSVYITKYIGFIAISSMELGFILGKIRDYQDGIKAQVASDLALFKIKTYEETGMFPIDCRSEEGVTIGLIDSLITQARLLSSRSLDTENIQEALNDLRADADIKKIFLYPTAQKTPPCVGHDKEVENGIAFQQWVDCTEELPKPDRLIQAEAVGYDKPIFAWVLDKRNCILLDDKGNQVFAKGEGHPTSFKLVNVNRWRYYERIK